MTDLPLLIQEGSNAQQKALLGPLGYGAVFCWALGITLLAPASWILPAAIISLLVIYLVFPLSARRLLRRRWLVLFVLMVAPVVLSSSMDLQSGWSFSLQFEGILLGVQILLRMVVFLTALSGFTAVVDISMIAGVLERMGMKGLGFSMGVAINFLPSLQRSAWQSWRSLKMRGGFRHRRWQALRYLALTVSTNAIRRAEDIARAAQARAFSPEISRAVPIKFGRLDRALLAIIMLALLVLAVLR